MEAGRGHLPPNNAFRTARLRLQLSQDELASALREAGWLGCDRRAVQRYEQGVVTRPQFVARRALGAVFKVAIRDLGLGPDDQIHSNPAAGSQSSREESLTRSGSAWNSQDVHRRSILQGIALAGAAAASGLEPLRALQVDIDQAIGGQAASLEEWRQVVVEYGYTYPARSAQDLLPDIASDLCIMRAAMKNVTLKEHPEWCRVMAGLSMVMAMTLSNLSRSREARTWWRTAQSAADKSRDVDLSLWITSGRLTRGMYERQPLRQLLDMSTTATQRPSTAPGRGTAELSAVHAQLLAMAGRHTDATREIGRAWRLLDELPPSVSNDVASYAGWGPNRLHYTEAWVYAHLGNQIKVDEAVERSRAALPAEQQRNHAQLQLLQASGHVASGDVDTGLQQAATALQELPATMRTVTVSSMATMTLDAVPAGQRSQPVVGSYRDLLTSMGGSLT